MAKRIRSSKSFKRSGYNRFSLARPHPKSGHDHAEKIVPLLSVILRSFGGDIGVAVKIIPPRLVDTSTAFALIAQLYLAAQ
jgi:hypothetical protein